MSYLIALLGAIFAFGLIVALHEAGHFLMARACGIHVERFSIGFGRAIFKRTDKRGTEFVLAWLPLGGYVKMYGDDGVNIPDEKAHLAYINKPVWRRMLVVLAGPLANFVVAIVVFSLVFSLGFSQIKPVIGKVTTHSIVYNAGVSSQDTILAIGDESVHSWPQVVMQLLRYAGSKDPLAVTVKTPSFHVKTVELDLTNWSLNSRNAKLFKSLGFSPYQPPIPATLGKIEPGSSAYNAGLKVGDTIVAINQKPVSSWLGVIKVVQAHRDQRLLFTLQRHGALIEKHVDIGSHSFNGKKVGFLGAVVKAPQYPKRYARYVQYPWYLSVVPALKQTWQLIRFNALVLKQMIVNRISVKTLGGPISIFKTAGQASLEGLIAYLGFLAYISITLGFLNILPIPVLDGGHFVMQLIEFIRGKPLSERVQSLAMRVGLALILMLMVYATGNDLIRLFS